MRHPTHFWLSGLSLAAAVLLAPTLAPAQTPEPAAGNPAINGTPAPGGTQVPMASAPMASPSSEAQIPKGSNPDSGSGNMAAGSGATPSPQALDNSVSSPLPQTANNPDSSGNNAAMGSNTNGSKSPEDTMPQGKYASPPTSSSPQ